MSLNLPMTGCPAALARQKTEIIHVASANVNENSCCNVVRATEIIDEFNGLSNVPRPIVRISSHLFCVVCSIINACHLKIMLQSIHNILNRMITTEICLPSICHYQKRSEFQ